MRIINFAVIASSAALGIWTVALFYFAYRANKFVDVAPASIAYTIWAILIIMTFLSIVLDSVMFHRRNPVRNWTWKWRHIRNMLFVAYACGLATILYLQTKPWELEYLAAARKCGDSYAERVKQNWQATGQCGEFPDFEICHLQENPDRFTATYINDPKISKVGSDCEISFRFKLSTLCRRYVQNDRGWYCSPYMPPLGKVVPGPG